MIGLPGGEKTMTMLSRFHLIPERHWQTVGRTNRQTELLYQYRASVCWRAIKNEDNTSDLLAGWSSGGGCNLLRKSSTKCFPIYCQAAVYTEQPGTLSSGVFVQKTIDQLHLTTKF